MDALLRRTHERVVDCPVYARIVVGIRLLLASGFILPGLVKVLGHRFTIVPDTMPVGAFFEAMYQTGAYWRFLGLTQIVAAVLIVIPRTALMGAAVFFTLTLNIAVLTIAIGFQGTPYIAVFMLIAAVALLLWDYPALRPLFGLASTSPLAKLTPVRLTPLEWIGAVTATTVAWFATLTSAGIVGAKLSVSLTIGGVIGLCGALLLFGPVFVARFGKRSAG